MPAIQPPPPAELTVTAKPESLAPLLEFLGRAIAALGLDPDIASRVRLAAEEATTNVIQYGYAGREPGPLLLRLERGPGAVTITIEDRGAPFDPASLEPLPLDASWQERSSGGLGWHLARQVMDEVRHEPLPGGGNRATLIVRLTGPGH